MINIIKAEYKRLIKSVAFYLGFVVVVLSIVYFTYSSRPELKSIYFYSTNEHALEYIDNKDTMTEDERVSLGRIALFELKDYLDSDYFLSNSRIMELSAEDIDLYFDGFDFYIGYAFFGILNTYSNLIYAMLLFGVLFFPLRHQSGSIRRDVTAGKSRISIFISEFLINIFAMFTYVLFNTLLVFIVCKVWHFSNFIKYVTLGEVLAIVSVLLFIAILTTINALCIDKSIISTTLTCVVFVILFLISMSLVVIGDYHDFEAVSYNSEEAENETNVIDYEWISYMLDSYNAELKNIGSLELSYDDIVKATHGEYKEEICYTDFYHTNSFNSMMDLFNPVSNVNALLLFSELSDITRDSKGDKRLILKSEVAFIEVTLLLGAGLYIFNRKDLK